MIKAGEELLRLQEENQKLGARIYDLSSRAIALEQDKIDLAAENKKLKDGIAMAREEIQKEYEHYYMVASREFVGLKMAIDILNSYLPKESEEQDAN